MPAGFRQWPQRESMHMHPAVSIIMPAFNVTPYIGMALDSVFAQTFRDFEVVVVNDGCPDTTNLERVLGSYASRVCYIKQSNGGVGAARRTAVLAADAPLIAQLDPDDWWEPDYLEVQLRLLNANPDVDLIYPNGLYFGDSSLEGKLLMDYAGSDGEVSFCSLLDGRVNIIYSALIRKEAIVRAGNFDPAFRTSEDFDLWMRILKSGGKIVYHRAPLLHYRLRADSLMSRSIEAQEWFLRVLENAGNTLPLSEEERASVERRKTAVRMAMELARGKEAIKRRRWRDARWHLELYQRYHPNRKISLVLFLLRCCPWLLGTGLSTRDRLLEAGLLKAKRPQQA